MQALMCNSLHVRLRNDLEELVRVNGLAESFLSEHGIAREKVFATILSLEEILSNVIRHGYEDSNPHEIAVRLAVRVGLVDLWVVDDGLEFDPLSAPDVDVFAPLEERKVGGLGIHLLRQMTSAIRYRRTCGRNHLHVRI